jgi:REP element-mobilizing transposase RayT
MTSINVPKYSPPFEPGHFFHVYNHAVGSEVLFRENENYRFFLDRFSKYLNSTLSLYAYCLLPNHFHLVIKVSDQTSCEKVSEQFRKFLISYSKAINKQYSRRGSLFEKHLKRITVTTDEYLLWLVFYLHRNPVHHHYSKNFRNYPWSSYQSLISKRHTALARNEIIDLFSGKENFISFHEKNIADYEAIQELLLE